MSWQAKPLGEVCHFQRGLTYAKSDEVTESGNIVLRANNIDLDTNQLDLSELRHIRKEIAIPESKKIKQGSLIICTASGSKSHLGKVALVDQDYGYAFGGFMGQLTPRPELHPKYLFRLMTSRFYKDFIDGLSDGANINNLKFDDLGKFGVSFPELAEQHRIVAILDEAFAGIATAKANAEKNLRNAGEVFEAEARRIFSNPAWPRKFIGDIFTLQRGLDLPTQDRIPGKFALVSSSGIIDTHNEGPVTAPGVVTGRSGSIGNVFYLEESFWPLNTTLYVRDFKGNIPRFIYHLMISLDLRQFSGGTGVPTLNRNDVHAAFSSVPEPQEEQHRVVAKLDTLRNEVSQLQSLATRKLAALDELKQSLLQRAFTGQL